MQAIQAESDLVPDQETVCDLSCHTHHDFLRTGRNHNGDEVVLVQCSACDLVFQEPRPTREAVDSFYKNTELWTNSKDPEGKSRSYVNEFKAKKPFFKSLAKRIEFRKKGGLLLDVGCGPGALENVLDSRKWTVTGVDFSPFIVKFGRENLNAHIIEASFEEVDLPEHTFDVVVMKYTLDHMDNPFEVLKKVRRLIKPDGLLVLADLINIDSFCARFFREGYRLIQPMHFTYFTPKTIRHYLRRAGFEVERVEFPYFDTPYFNLRDIQSLVARILKKYFLFFIRKIDTPVQSVPFFGNFMDVWAYPSSAKLEE